MPKLCSALHFKQDKNKVLLKLQMIPESPSMKRTQFEKDSNKLHINPLETFFDILLNLTEVDTKTYQKEIQ